MAETKVKINISGLNRFFKGIEHTQSGPMDSMFKQWGARYLGFARKRFIVNSRGGGDWKGLAESTKKRRRGGKTTRRKGKRRKTSISRGHAILRDTGTLLGALSIGAPGNMFDRIPSGIRVGFGGPTRHPGGGATIKDIAVFHDEGGGHLPQRQIIIDPDATTANGMAKDAKRAIAKIGRQSQI